MYLKMVPLHRIELQITDYKTVVIPFNYKGLKLWWKWSGSNRLPTACKAAALPNELHPQLITYYLIAEPDTFLELLLTAAR